MVTGDDSELPLSAGDGHTGSVRILLVPDDSVSRDRAAAAIEAGADRFAVATATDPEAALATVAEGGVDCVVSGYDFPETDGVALLRAVRDRAGDLPFVVFTGRGSEAVASEAVAAGADEYLPADGDGAYERLASRVDCAVSQSRAERRVAEHVDRMTDAFCGIDESWRLTYLNERARDLLDRDAESLLGDRIWDLFPEIRDTETEAELREAMSTGTPTTFDLHAEQFGRDFSVDAYPSTAGLSVYFRDVTEARERERKLRELSERFQLAAEGAAVGVWDWDLTTNEVQFDDRWAGMLGYDKSEIDFELSGWERRVHPEDIDEVWAEIEAHFAGETELYQCDYRMETKGGDWIWIRDRGRVVERTDEGEPVRAVGIHIDVTEEKQRARERERYRRFVDELPHAVALYDADGRFATANERVATVYESTRAELVGRESPLVERLREHGDGDPFAALVAGDREQVSETVELDLPYRDDAIVDASLQRLVIDGEFDGVLGIARDVTEERRRQRELERTSARLEALYEDSPDMVSIHDASGTIVDANPVIAAKLGYDRDEVAGMSVWDIDEERTPDDSEEVWKDLAMGETRRLETTFKRADDTTFPVEMQIRRVDVRGADRYLATSRDISERKAYERRIERENERLDEFASIVSHDLRNPLTVLSGYLQLARETGEDSHFDRCESALDDMDRLIEDVLTLARQGDAVGSFDHVSFDTLATGFESDVFGRADGGTDDAVAGRANGSGEYVEVAIDADDDLLADSGRLKRLLQNLFRNAAEHGGEEVVVGDLEGGFYVEDDGPGIPEERRETVFESGHTTSESGTGFGLAIVERIAEAHGWEVTLTEGDAGGARFEFTGVDRP